MLLNAQQLALEILSNMCCPEGKVHCFVLVTDNVNVLYGLDGTAPEVQIYPSSHSQLLF